MLQKDKSQDTRITSWEEYNYILVGLVDELINLGANNRFKKIVLKLWTKYLQTIEAAFFSLHDECLPRLPANYMKKDAEILYNKHHRKRRRRRNSCSSVDTATTKSSGGKADSVIKSFKISKVIKKTKAELARAQFEDYKRLEEDSSSVATSLATSSQRSAGAEDKSQVSLNLEFTKHARRQLKRKMHKSHIKKHESDYEDTLECHQEHNKRRVVDKMEELDNGVLISIIILGLNLSQDAIQASDLIRFLREGHVSYYNVRHFLPENVKLEGIIHFEYVAKRAIFNHASLRQTAAKLFHDMALPELIRPDLTAMVHRYVDELGLPEEMKILVDKLMAFHPPCMEFNRQTKMKICVPNYEGRAMSYIIFVLKSMFGLDDEREARISESAKAINELLEKSHPNLRLFVVDDWLRMLRMRQLVVEARHLPSATRQPWRDFGALSKGGVGNWQRYIEHVKTMHEVKLVDEGRMKSDSDGVGVAYNTMLILTGVNERNKQERLKQEEEGEGEEDRETIKIENGAKGYTFSPSMTPYRDYTKVILEDPSISADVEAYLTQDFSLTSMQPFYEDKLVIGQLKKALKKECLLKLRVKELGLESRHVHVVKSNRFKEEGTNPNGLVKLEFVTKEEAAKLLGYRKRKEAKMEERVPVKIAEEEEVKEGEIRLNISNMDYWTHYTSYNIIKMPFNAEAYAEELRILPNNFKFLVFECARIVEQDPRFMLLELALLERVLIHEKAGLAEFEGYEGKPPLALW